MRSCEQASRTAAAIALFIGTAAFLVSAVRAQDISFDAGEGQLTVQINGAPIATYHYEHDEIKRPFFANVRTPSGIRVTRAHPPEAGQDLTDHGTYHPGIWMSYGDVSGSDYWRLKASVRHAEFVEQPRGGTGEGTFAVRNELLDQFEPTRVVCNELCRFAFYTRPHGYLLAWDVSYQSDRQFVFGDQEEMGLAIRMATPLRVDRISRSLPPNTGTILDSKGRKNGDEIWGNAAKWCDYSGTVNGQRVGITIFCHPGNFRPSWFHARNNGLLAANPFGRAAFGKGDPSAVVVEPGSELRLRYGIFVHADAADQPLDLQRAYADYVKLSD